MLADLGLSPLDAAKMLHVSLRTLQNWLSGHHEVPYAAYKLLRLMRYMELPGESWAGWHFSCGQLVTPEGRTISGAEGSWWSLLVQQARGFGKVYRELNALKAAHAGGPAAVGRAGDSPRAAGLAAGLDGMGFPVTPHPSLTNETNCPKTGQSGVTETLPGGSAPPSG